MLGDLEGFVFFVPFVYLGFAAIAYFATKSRFQP